MRILITALTLLLAVTWITPSFAAETSRVEKYLHTGKYNKGERELLAELTLNPDNDELRFGLGVLQFIHSIENLGQSLHHYGVKSEATDIPFLRLPIPENPQPHEIDYRKFRKVLDKFHKELTRAEVTLGAVKDDDVKLPMRLAAIRVDFDGDGEATQTLLEIMDAIFRRDLPFLKDNPDFRVTFDRGDVAWLRSYCHVLMGMIDAYQTFDFEVPFNHEAHRLFAKPSISRDEAKTFLVPEVVTLAEPDRLSHFRRHLIRLAELNDETWKHIRAERDDDYEWLPNPKQQGLFGVRVRDEMIDAWLGAMNELRLTLEGERTLPPIFSNRTEGLNLKLFLDDPPREWHGDLFEELPDKYYTDDQVVNYFVLFRAASVFQGPDAFFFVAWFN